MLGKPKPTLSKSQAAALLRSVKKRSAKSNDFIEIISRFKPTRRLSINAKYYKYDSLTSGMSTIIIRRINFRTFESNQISCNQIIGHSHKE